MGAPDTYVFKIYHSALGYVAFGWTGLVDLTLAIGSIMGAWTGSAWPSLIIAGIGFLLYTIFLIVSIRYLVPQRIRARSDSHAQRDEDWLRGANDQRHFSAGIIVHSIVFVALLWFALRADTADVVAPLPPAPTGVQLTNYVIYITIHGLLAAGALFILAALLPDAGVALHSPTRANLIGDNYPLENVRTLATSSYATHMRTPQ